MVPVRWLILISVSTTIDEPSFNLTMQGSLISSISEQEPKTITNMKNSNFFINIGIYPPKLAKSPIFKQKGEKMNR